MLDYVFYKLAIPTETVQHPIVMTEPLCNPHYSRSRKWQLAVSVARSVKSTHSQLPSSHSHV